MSTLFTCHSAVCVCRTPVYSTYRFLSSSDWTGLLEELWKAGVWFECSPILRRSQKHFSRWRKWRFKIVSHGTSLNVPEKFKTLVNPAMCIIKKRMSFTVIFVYRRSFWRKQIALASFCAGMDSLISLAWINILLGSRSFAVKSISKNAKIICLTNIHHFAILVTEAKSYLISLINLMLLTRPL